MAGLRQSQDRDLSDRPAASYAHHYRITPGTDSDGECRPVPGRKGFLVSCISGLFGVVLLSALVLSGCGTPSGRHEGPGGDSIPEPVGELHSDLAWLKEQKVRGIWIGGDLFDPFPGSTQTKGQVLAEAGFNLVVLYTGVSRDNRETSPDFASRIPRNLEAARECGLEHGCRGGNHTIGRSLRARSTHPLCRPRGGARGGRGAARQLLSFPA